MSSKEDWKAAILTLRRCIEAKRVSRDDKEILDQVNSHILQSNFPQECEELGLYQNLPHDSAVAYVNDLFSSKIGI